jgi:glycosyltransferase involved in cell wall biosynthesis
MTRALRLLYLLPAEGFGGAERQGVYHLAELPHHAVEVTGLVGPSESVERELAAVNVPHEPFPHFPDRAHGPLKPALATRYLVRWLESLARCTRAIERRMAGRRFDLIFANRTFAWLIAASLSRRLAVPYVLRAGSLPRNRALGLGLPLLDWAARPRAVFSNCEAVDRGIASHFHTPRFLLPNAIDTHRFAPGSSLVARARLGLPPGVPLVGLAARPAPEKGFELFAQVVARVTKARPTVRFVVAGEFGWRAHYESLLRAAGLGTSVHFLGHVEAMEDFFRAVDVVVLTSRAGSIEASPNALLEAMATGRPIVATAVGGVPELVAHEREARLVEPDDAAQFASDVVLLLSSPERRAELGRAGRLRALARHRVSTVVADLSEHLRALVFPAGSPVSSARQPGPRIPAQDVH